MLICLGWLVTSSGMWQTATYTLDPLEKGESLSVSLYDVSEPGNTRMRFDATVVNARSANASGAQGATQVTPMIALGSGWSTNLSRGCKADVFCGFDFTWPYSTGESVSYVQPTALRLYFRLTIRDQY